MLCVALSQIANRNGLSAQKVGMKGRVLGCSNGAFSAAAIARPVAAAASVPFSFTSTNVLCSTAVM